MGRPEHLIVSHLAVPPVAIRPSVEMDGASNEDDITMKLMVSVYVCGGGVMRGSRVISSTQQQQHAVFPPLLG